MRDRGGAYSVVRDMAGILSTYRDEALGVLRARMSWIVMRNDLIDMIPKVQGQERDGVHLASLVY